MSKIYDNIGDGQKFKEILQAAIAEENIKRMDFCVGYFNLRGWDFIANEINELEGDWIYEGEDNDNRVFRTARLLIGMQRAPEEIIRMKYRKNFWIDSDYVQKCRRKIAEDFRKQLLIGNTSTRDEITLKYYVSNLKTRRYV